MASKRVIEWRVQTWTADGALSNSYNVLETTTGVAQLKRFLEKTFPKVAIVPTPKKSASR